MSKKTESPYTIAKKSDDKILVIRDVIVEYDDSNNSTEHINKQIHAIENKYGGGCVWNNTYLSMDMCNERSIRDNEAFGFEGNLKIMMGMDRTVVYIDENVSDEMTVDQIIDAFTKMESELDKLSEYVSKNKDVSTLTIPVQNVYKVTCSVGFDIDFILIRATSEMEAWNKFWEHFKDEPNLDHEDFGSKEDYEYTRGHWKRKDSNVSITIEPIKAVSDFLYIGGGRNV